MLSNWPMTAIEAGVDLALIQTSLLFSCKCKLVNVRITCFTSLPLNGQVTEQTTVKWFIRRASLYDIRDRLRKLKCKSLCGNVTIGKH